MLGFPIFQSSPPAHRLRLLLLFQLPCGTIILFDITMDNQYSEQSSCDSDDDRLDKHQPRFFKHSGGKINTNNLYINLTNCHYQVLSQLADDMDFRVTSNKHNWDLYWTDHAIQKQQLFRLLDHQKINHFPGMYVLARKNYLAKGLTKMRKSRPSQYNFFPLTWMLPSEYNELKIFREQLAISEENEDQAVNQKTAFIVKPEASCQGRGIKITLEPEKVTEQCIVQIYISNPFLIGGLKFDFRLYVLLAGCDPLRIYLYREGLARFSTETYNYHPSKKNLKKTMIHLTNYAINKSNPKFVFNKNVNQAHIGHKRSYTAVMRSLAEMGVETFILQQKINQIIVKTIISGQPFLAHQYNLSLPDNYANDMCFQILGFDILIDENTQPYLLQVNHTPSFVADTPLDHHIKYNLIKDTIKLMNITVESKKEKVLARQQFTQERDQGKSKKYTPKQKYLLKRQQQVKRDHYQNTHLGNYQKIYPTEGKELMRVYDDLLYVSDGLFRKQNIRVKQKSLPLFKKSISVMQTIPRKLPSKELPPLKKIKSTQFSPLKLKIAQLSKELETQMDHGDEELVNLVTHSLRRNKKSLTTTTNPHNYSPTRESMIKTLISLKYLPKAELVKNPEMIELELAKKAQKGSKAKEGAFLQPKVLKLQNKPSKQPKKGFHYIVAGQQKLPLNYERYILKHTQNKKRERQGRQGKGAKQAKQP